MARTRVKICGITNPDDAVAAAACGVDAIGLIFHPASPRSVSVEVATQILAVLPPFVTPVALFVDATTETIIDVTRQVGLRHVQLHGNEAPAMVEALSGYVVIKAVRVERKTFAKSIQRWSGLADLRGIVLETGGTDKPGGTGIANDWEFICARQAAGDFEGLPPIIVAGGLKPTLVATIVRSLRPFAVDVSSGVETSRGKKSAELMRQFVEEVEHADGLQRLA